MTEDELKVVRAMKVYGGAFVQALAECFYHADANNLYLLKNTWPEYWKQYTEMAERAERQGL